MVKPERLLSDLSEWKIRLSQITSANHMIERQAFLEFIHENSLLEDFAHIISEQLNSTKAVEILTFASLLFKILDDATHA